MMSSFARPLRGIDSYLPLFVIGGLGLGLMFMVRATRSEIPFQMPRAAYQLLPLVPLLLTGLALARAWELNDEEPMLVIGGVKFMSAHMAGHFLITGATRSGKTAAAMKPILGQLLKNSDHIGGLVLAVKSNFADILQNLANATGRGEDIIRVRIEEGARWRYNPYADNKIQASLLSSRLKAAWKNVGGSTGESFWVDKAVQACEYAIRLLRLIGTPVALNEVHSILTQDSALAKAMTRLLALAEDTEEKQQVEKWFGEHWIRLAPDTKTGVEANIGTLLHPFCDPVVASVFCADSTFSIEDCGKGKIVVLDVAPSTWGNLAKSIAVLLKCDLVDTALRRLELPAAEIRKLRWQFLAIDEYQEFCTVGTGERGDDATFNIIGETRTIGIISTQGHSEIIAKAGRDELARPIYNNLTNKIYFRAGDKVSATKATEEIGSREVTELSRTYSSGQGRSSVAHHKKRKLYIEPDQMMNLPPFVAVIKRNDGRWKKAWCQPFDDNGDPFTP